ncbi:MAG: SIR2 family protein [Candidatus Heimdallarchaeaceae archaeon]
MVSIDIKEAFEKTVLFLGAGASYDAGCLTSTSMVHDLKEQILAIKDDQKKILFRQVYDFIIATLLYQFRVNQPDAQLTDENINIEDFVRTLYQISHRDFVVPRPLIGNWNDRISIWESQVPNIFEDIDKLIKDCLIEKWLSFDIKKAESILSPINSILTSSEVFEINVFTLNYDLVFESVVNKDPSDLVLSDGFDGSNWTGNFDKKINYYKLHGSLNWYLDKETESIRKIDNQAISPEPLIIFGSDNKMLSFEPFLNLITEFYRKLKQANLLIVIGYSFQDKYINNLIIQQLMDTRTTKKMLIVDPSCEEESESFVKRLQDTQIMRDSSESVSFTKLNRELVETYKTTAAEFIRSFFSNEAYDLREKLQQILKEYLVF